MLENIEIHTTGQPAERRDDVPGLAAATRIERVEALANALGDAHPEDAEAMCLAFLADREIGAPGVPFFDLKLDDMRWWVGCASLPEVSAAVIAGLERLSASALPIGVRKRALVGLWGLLPPAERVAFLRRVDPTGKFIGRAA